MTYRLQNSRKSNFATEPTFVNPAQGDFTLAPGSPGKGAASDGTDIGMAWNAYLKQDWAAKIFALPTVERTTGSAQSLRVETSAAYQYQVYVYLADGTDFRGIETFTIEGWRIQRD